jgi:hypothetical protein
MSRNYRLTLAVLPLLIGGGAGLRFTAAADDAGAKP